VPVEPLVGFALFSAGAALVVSLIAAWFPARQAAKLDPCVCFQEV